MIKDIEIIEYKCFKNLKLEGLSRINIITGGNNVGKTALLEALFIEDRYDYDSLLEIAKNRDISEKRLEIYFKEFKFKTINNNISYKSKYELSKEEKEELGVLNKNFKFFLTFYIENTLIIEPINDISYNNYSDNSYINSSKPNNRRLIKLYSNIQTKGIQHKFLTYLQLLDRNIAWIEPQLIADELILRVNLTNPEYSVVSSELGEGTNRYIEILASLLSNSGGVVFIDEIENGIHYSKLKDIWKAIIEIVEKENIQLFVTTHNDEVIEALNQASEEMKFEDITSIRLFKNRDNKISSIVHQYDTFSYGINRGADIR